MGTREKSFEHGDISGFLDEGTDFQGTLNFRDTMRIDGKFRGKITSKNVLIVGETADIEADIVVSIVSINGHIKGTIAADKKVEIHSKGRVYCDISTPNLVVEDGAIFHGNCNMGDFKPAAEARPEPSRAESISSSFSKHPEPPVAKGEVQKTADGKST